MTWLIVILVVAAWGGIVGYLNTGKSEDALTGAVGAGVVRVHHPPIFIALAGLAFYWWLFVWLKGAV